MDFLSGLGNLLDIIGNLASLGNEPSGTKKSPLKSVSVFLLVAGAFWFILEFFLVQEAGNCPFFIALASLGGFLFTLFFSWILFRLKLIGQVNFGHFLLFVIGSTLVLVSLAGFLNRYFALGLIPGNQ